MFKDFIQQIVKVFPRPALSAGSGGRIAPPPGGGSEQSAPRDGDGPGMCARPHFSALSRRQGARAARDRSGSGRKRQDNAAGAGKTMALSEEKGQVS